MPDFTSPDVIGAWISIFLTLCILSFLFEDNPIYKLAEHLFLGVSIGYSVVEIYYGVFKPNLIDKLFDPSAWTLAEGWGADDTERAFLLVPLVFALLLFAKFTKKYGWLARLPVAFIIAAYAGVKLTGEARAHLMTGIKESMPNLREAWALNLPEGTQTTLRVFRDGAWTDRVLVGTCLDGDTWYAGIWCWSNDGAGVFSAIMILLFAKGIASYVIFLAETTLQKPKAVCAAAYAKLDSYTVLDDMLADIAPGDAVKMNGAEQ